MATTAGQIIVDLVANVAGLKTDLARANRSIDDFSTAATRSLSSLTKMAGTFMSAFAGIGIGFGAAGLASLVRSATDAADKIGDLSEQLGISTTSLQAFQYAARDVGAGADAVTTGFAKLNKTLGEAGQGNQEAVKKFRDLKIAYAESGQLRATEDVIRDVANAIQRAGSTAEATAIATELLGKGAAPLVPIFRDGAAGIDKMTAALEKAGLIVGEKTLTEADALAKKLDEMATTIQTMTIKAVMALQPELMALAEAFLAAANAAGKFFSFFRGYEAQSLEDLDKMIEAQEQRVAYLKKIYGTMPAPELARAQAELVKMQGARMYQQLEKDLAPRAPARKLGGKIVDPDAAKKAKASDERVKANFEAAQAELKFYEEIGELENKRRLAEDAARDKLVADDTAAYLARLKEAEAFQADIDRLSADFHTKEQARLEAEIATERDAYLERVKQAEVFQAEIDRITADYYRDEQARLDADLAKRMESFDKVFGAFERAFETSVTGIIQGTTTLETAFQKMGQSIAISLGETAVKEGVDALKKALKELLQSKLVQDLIKAGLSAAGGLFTSGVTVAPVQNIDYNFGGAGMPMAAGGIVQSPTFAVVGEAGPEAVVPLDRWGEMGGGVTVNIIDQRREGNVQTQEKTTASGERQVDVLITDVVRAGLAGGSYDRALGGSFGLSRRGVQR